MAITPQTWSTTAASNTDVDGSADTDIDENNFPRTVNNAQRAMIAGVAMLRDALKGVKVSGGTADAQTLTTGLALTAYADMPLIAFEAGAGLTNTTTTTMTIDGIGGGAKTIKRADGSNLSAGDITAGGIYLLAYEPSAGVLILINPVPAGSSSNPQFATIELSHATANTLSASSGVLSIEGVALLRASQNLADVTTAATAFANIKQAATDSATGVVELAIASEVNTGTDTARAITPDALAGSIHGTFIVSILVFNDAEDVVVGDGAGNVFWRVPSSLNGMDLVAVGMHVATAGVTGTLTVQIHNKTQAADMLSTKLTIDTGEKDSKDAATPAVIDTGNDDVATGDEIRIDVDVTQTTEPLGLIVDLAFRTP